MSAYSAQAQVTSLNALADYSPGSIVSRSIVKSDAGTVTFFAFAKGEALSPHSAPYDAFVYVGEGRAKITIGEKEHLLSAGDSILMPAHVPHAVHAEENFKMLLVMVKGEPR